MRLSPDAFDVPARARRPRLNRPAAVPRHVAIVMDGNGRWAKKRFLPRFFGHKQGVDALVRTVAACADRGIEYLTVFAFSSENWKRPEEEVSGLMGLVLVAVSKYLTKLAGEGVRIRIVGDRSAVSDKVRQAWDQAETATAHNRRITLSVAFNYGGRWDVVQACRQAIAAGSGRPARRATLARFMTMSYAPDPDLFIRTGGEMRVSNFLLWQVAYAELFFTDCLWPDFDASDIDAALTAFRQRDRRFGGVKTRPTRRRRARRRRLKVPMLKQRIVTALVLLALLLPALFASNPWPFDLLTMLLIGVAGWEWSRLNESGDAPSIAFGIALVLACAAALGVGWTQDAPTWVWWLAALVWVPGGAWALRLGPDFWPVLPRFARRVLGGLALWTAWLALANAKTTDSISCSRCCASSGPRTSPPTSADAPSAAQAAPSISPGKSWAGVWSGMLGVFVLAALWIVIDRSSTSIRRASTHDWPSASGSPGSPSRWSSSPP